MRNIAIVGLGLWGKNLLKEFSKIGDVTICCTRGNRQNVKWLKHNYPKVKHTKNFNDIIKDKKTNVVVIATPINTHFSLVSKALKSGKHVFVEKTITEKVSEAIELYGLAKQKK